jgi:branched-chain amino acid transport system substrate-binding protein
VLNQLPPATAEAAVGDLVPSPYSPDLDTDESRAFVAAVQEKLGVVPDDTESGPYGAALIIIEALKATNGDTTPAALMQALLNVNLTGPEGSVSFDQATKVLIRNIYICKVAKEGTGYALQHVFSYEGVGANGLQ